MTALLKYGFEEKSSSLYKCSIVLGFILSKNLRGLWFYLLIKVQNATSLVFFDIKKPRRIEHLQREEPFSSDPYFSLRSRGHLKDLKDSKGQLILKANCQAEDSSKKRRMNFFLLVCDMFSFVFWKNPPPAKNVSRLSDL